jgi:hypothetical protein
MKGKLLTALCCCRFYKTFFFIDWSISRLVNNVKQINGLNKKIVEKFCWIEIFSYLCKPKLWIQDKFI